MSLYKNCSDLVSKSHMLCEVQPETTMSLVTMDNSNAAKMAIPSCIKREEIGWLQRTVYYISDLHLVQHIVKRFSIEVSDVDVQEYVHGIVLQLFDDEFGDAIRAFENPIVFFGGDIASSFSISAIFYQDFVSTWKNIVDAKYSLCCQALAPITDELDRLSEWENKHPWIYHRTKPIEEYSDKKIPHRIKDLFARKDELTQAADAKRKELHISYYWKSDYESARKHSFIFTILGNHELWDFSSYEDCENAYNKLFQELDIAFLNDRGIALGSDFNPMVIVGGLGFAAKNKIFNANQGIYGEAICRDEEIKRGGDWNQLYKKALEIAQKRQRSLIVLSHTPISDWMEQFEIYDNCYFFSGHTHRNVAYASDRNSFIFADNQIGYEKSNFHFKKAILHMPRNPFAADSDGYRKISVDEYKEYYLYVQDNIPGTGIIERQIKQYDASLYALKQDDYYAFLLSSPRGTYICNGGQIRKIGPPGSLEPYMKIFMPMVNAYLTALSPLRRTQEQLSKYIKGFGGKGRIHGTIVDIDFENHVMINTYDGTLSFYNSPMFGVIKTYSNIGELLHAHCPQLETEFLAKGKDQLIFRPNTAISDATVYEKIDIKNSQYAISRRVNALQRLFDKNILRDWNTDIFLQKELD